MFVYEDVPYEEPLARLTISDTSHLNEAEIDRLVRLLQREAIGKVQRGLIQGSRRVIIAHYGSKEEALDAELDVIMRLTCVVEIEPEVIYHRP